MGERRGRRGRVGRKEEGRGRPGEGEWEGRREEGRKRGGRESKKEGGREEGRGGRVEVMMTFRLRSEVFLRPVRGQVSSLDEQQHSRRLSFSLFYSSRLKPGTTKCSSHVTRDASCGYTKYTRLGWTRKKTRPKSPSYGSVDGHITNSGTSM